MAFTQALAAAAIAFRAPARESPAGAPPSPPSARPNEPPGAPPKPAPRLDVVPVAGSCCSPRTQRILPAATSLASQETLTSLSRPENPPIPATFACSWMIADAAIDWLDTAIVPPP